MPSIRRFTQADRQILTTHPAVVSARKSARVLAIRLPYPFEVVTDRGLMTAQAGDWLVTNHPDDDVTSDLWSVSNDRFEATYKVTDAYATTNPPQPSCPYCYRTDKHSVEGNEQMPAHRWGIG